MVKQKTILQQLAGISLGLVLVLIWSFFFLRADVLFGVGAEAWQTRITTYVILLAFVFSFNALGSRSTEEVLFRVSFIREIPKFILATLISFTIFFVMGIAIQGSALTTIFSAVSLVGIGVVFTHAIIVAPMEELIFRGFIRNELKALGIQRNLLFLLVPIIFAIFHALIGRSFILLLIYIPLGMLFELVRQRFSPKTNMANSGVHSAWNLFILGFFS